ncbi:thioesterase family protein [Oceanomicrobium pacificus]|uniref:Thioesterase n=1 Tax=Oceanomicrobium pacificus TaxID=2692916 RepID=A0A6B0TRU8_9RHOB|nr:thioesterase family protein [Oceanomicrobium pacificus]MXU65439.1 thioesterase [Oceanomicrobium pacificus]
MAEPIGGHDGPYDAPVRIGPRRVARDWIDYNGHMNVTYYTQAFDDAVDVFLARELGVGPDYVAAQGQGPYALQSHMHYLGELLEGASFTVAVRLLDADAKRLHLFMELVADETGDISATCEQVLMNVDLTLRRSTAYPEKVQSRFRRMRDNHRNLPAVAQQGAPIGIRR